MQFMFSAGISETQDGVLRFGLTRTEPGVDRSDLEIQYQITCAGETRRHALHAKWIRSPDRCVAIRVLQQRELDHLLHLKARLGIEGSDLSFMRELAGGITGMFAVNPTLTSETTYLLTIAGDLASSLHWKGLPTAPEPLLDDLIIGSIVVPKARLEH